MWLEGAKNRFRKNEADVKDYDNDDLQDMPKS